MDIKGTREEAESIPDMDILNILVWVNCVLRARERNTSGGIHHLMLLEAEEIVAYLRGDTHKPTWDYKRLLGLSTDKADTHPFEF